MHSKGIGQQPQGKDKSAEWLSPACLSPPQQSLPFTRLPRPPSHFHFSSPTEGSQHSPLCQPQAQATTRHQGSQEKELSTHTITACKPQPLKEKRRAPTRSRRYHPLSHPRIQPKVTSVHPSRHYTYTSGTSGTPHSSTNMQPPIHHITKHEVREEGRRIPQCKPWQHKQ